MWRQHSAHFQVGVEDPDEGADGWVAAGLQDHESSRTVFPPENHGSTRQRKKGGGEGGAGKRTKQKHQTEEKVEADLT